MDAVKSWVDFGADASVMNCWRGGVPHLLRARNIEAEAAEALRAVFPEAKTLALVQDERTRAALGDRLARVLVNDGYELRALTLPGEPQPDEKTLDCVRECARNSDALLAVGGGTIGDACKYAGFLEHKPYAVFPTAPSMNGYASANASILRAGKKISVAAQLPALIAWDAETLARAPLRLRRAGLGDLLARPTAQADWLLSHLLLDTPYDERPFLLTAPHEAALFDAAEKIAAGDGRAVEALMRLLLFSGFGMTMAGGSHPASQGEHMIAHAYEGLAGGDERHAPYHGEEIAVTSLFMARLQERLLAAPAAGLRSAPSLPAECAAACAPKRALLARIGNRLGPREWPEIAARIRPVTLSSKRLAEVIGAMGAGAAPEDIGWNPARYRLARRLAPYTRDRFTFLDLSALPGN